MILLQRKVYIWTNDASESSLKKNQIFREKTTKPQIRTFSANLQQKYPLRNLVGNLFFFLFLEITVITIIFSGEWSKNLVVVFRDHLIFYADFPVLAQFASNFNLKHFICSRKKITSDIRLQVKNFRSKVKTSKLVSLTWKAESKTILQRYSTTASV